MNDIIFAGKHFLTFNVSRHKHESWELVYCTKDAGKFIFDDRMELPYAAGDIVVIPPEVPHENTS
ncbi:MAG: AraC family ligand binding domain-containing protein, partial [Clostridia bacterium]|nr:AraC family ligand binding domain-containing protein [Clostridia bacterium]